MRVVRVVFNARCFCMHPLNACMLPLDAFNAYPTCMPYVYALRLICVPYMCALYVCPTPDM